MTERQTVILVELVTLHGNENRNCRLHIIATCSPDICKHNVMLMGLTPSPLTLHSLTFHPLTSPSPRLFTGM